jgi:hypothetical protein
MTINGHSDLHAEPKSGWLRKTVLLGTLVSALAAGGWYAHKRTERHVKSVAMVAPRLGPSTLDLFLNKYKLQTSSTNWDIEYDDGTAYTLTYREGNSKTLESLFGAKETNVQPGDWWEVDGFRRPVNLVKRGGWP